MFCPIPHPTTRAYGARKRLCAPSMHAFGLRIIYFFLVTPLKMTFEYIVTERENAGKQRFILSPQCFLLC